MHALPEAVGYLAATLVLLTFLMKDMCALRIVAILSNIAFMVYGILNSLLPILVLHLLLLPLNVFRLAGARSERKSLRVAGRRQ